MNETNNIDNAYSTEEIRLTIHALSECFSKPIDTEYFYIETTNAKESS